MVALYFVGADKAPMQAALAAAGAVAPVVRLCRSGQPELQAEAVDVVKVLSRHPRASRVIIDLGEPWSTAASYARAGLEYDEGQ